MDYRWRRVVVQVELRQNEELFSVDSSAAVAHRTQTGGAGKRFPMDGTGVGGKQRRCIPGTSQRAMAVCRNFASIVTPRPGPVGTLIIPLTLTSGDVPDDTGNDWSRPLYS
jgi:hypothetical protein